MGIFGPGKNKGNVAPKKRSVKDYNANNQFSQSRVSGLNNVNQNANGEGYSISQRLEGGGKNTGRYLTNASQASLSNPSPEIVPQPNYVAKKLKNGGTIKKPMIKPAVRPAKTGDSEVDYGVNRAYTKQSMSENQSKYDILNRIGNSPEYKKHAPGEAGYAKREAGITNRALSAQKKTQEQDRKYITKTIAPKFEKGGTMKKDKGGDINPLDYVSEEQYKSLGDDPKIKVKGDKIKMKGNGKKIKLKGVEPRKITSINAQPKPELKSSLKSPAIDTKGGSGESFRSSIKDDGRDDNGLFKGGSKEVAEQQKRLGVHVDGIRGKQTIEAERQAKKKGSGSSSSSSSSSTSPKTSPKSTSTDSASHDELFGPTAIKKINDNKRKTGPTPNRTYDGSTRPKSGNKEYDDKFGQGALDKQSRKGPTPNRTYGDKPKAHVGLNGPEGRGATTPKPAPRRKSMGPELTEKEKGKSFMDYMQEGAMNSNQRGKEARERAKQHNKDNPRIGIDTVVLNKRRNMYERVEGGVGKDGKYTKSGIKLKNQYELKDGKVVNKSDGKEAVDNTTRPKSAKQIAMDKRKAEVKRNEQKKNQASKNTGWGQKYNKS